jgi:hypothetical protein
MSDSICAITVVLDHDHRPEEIQGLTQALLQLRGVASVEVRPTDNLAAMTERIRSDTRWREALFKLMTEMI